MNNYIIEGLIILVLAWCVRKYPAGITFIYSLEMVSRKENLPYLDYIAKCLFWVLLIIGSALLLKGLYEVIYF